MSGEYKGSCMCGQVHFSFSGQPRFVADCVCESCRKAHGATAVCWVGVKTEQFKVDIGASSISWFRSSPESERGFCTNCGTRMFFRSSKWLGETHMAVAAFATPHDLQSSKISFADEMPAWSALAPKKH